MGEEDVQFCPSCGSTEIEGSAMLTLGDPFVRDAMTGWECIDCGYVGKDFFIVSKYTHLEIIDAMYEKDLVYALV